jgi:hypothetical protein
MRSYRWRRERRRPLDRTVFFDQSDFTLIAPTSQGNSEQDGGLWQQLRTAEQLINDVLQLELATASIQ